MSTPAIPSQAGISQGTVIRPSAIAQAQPSAAFGLGQVLKEIIHAVPTAFQSENALLAAVTAIDKFVSAFVPASAIPALANGEQRAPVEDVSLRLPPPGAAVVLPNNIPAIDYDRLAASMVRAQYQLQRMEAASQPPAPAPAQITGENRELWLTSMMSCSKSSRY